MPDSKPEKPVSFGVKVPGMKAKEVHTVKKNKKGEIIVDHAGNKGKYDKINLTKKAGAKTIKQGVAATKRWHRSQGK